MLEELIPLNKDYHHHKTWGITTVNLIWDCFLSARALQFLLLKKNWHLEPGNRSYT